MDVVLSLIVVAVLIALLFFVRSKKSSGNRRPARPQPDSSKQDTAFHAVSIVYASNACQAARNMDGRRFLSSAAPRLPLPDCDVLECKCRFAHHKDRRKGDDRRNPYLHQFSGAGETGTHQKDKRKKRERREDPPDSF